MAVTKIWPIKDSLRRVVDYARNPEKTAFGDMKRLLHYAGDSAKTTVGDEKTLYVTGVNCRADMALQEMTAVQERFDKTTGNVAYHAYQSFKTGEVTPELCHRLGVELAQRMWGSGHQVLVATHFNTGTYHNHFVINAVGMWDGKKFDCNEGAYWRFRSLSDELCREHGLTVIELPGGKTPRQLYFAEKKGEPTRYNLMREAMDKALGLSVNLRVFQEAMRRMGYVVDLNPNHKYATIRSVNSQKATRTYHLGDKYTRKAICDRIEANGRLRYDATHWRYLEFFGERRHAPVKVHHVPRMPKAKKITGFRALYLHYCYLMGILPRKRPRPPLSPEMREACLKLERYSQQVRLVTKYGLQDVPAVQAFMESNRLQMRLLQTYREGLRKELATCQDPERRQELTEKRNTCTATLVQLRKEVKTASGILADYGEIKRRIAIEEQMRAAQRGPKRNRRRGMER